MSFTGQRALRFATSLALSALVCTAVRPVRAAANATDKAAAEALFDQGLKSMKKGSFAEACPKLEESERLDPAVGTLLYLGECYERTGRSASAWATFREAASAANNGGQTERERVATQRAAELEPKLSRLTLELSPEVARIPGVVVKRSGTPIESAIWGTALPVDPGEYRVEVTAPGYEPWVTSVMVPGNAGLAQVRVPALSKSPVEPAAPGSGRAAPPLAEPATGPAANLDLESSSGFTTRQQVGLVVSAVGVVGLGLGGFFGVRAIAKNSDAEADCPENLCRTQRGLDLTDDARHAATAANIAFTAGGLLAVTGAVLFFSGSPRPQSGKLRLQPVLGPDVALASFSGAF